MCEPAVCTLELTFPSHSLGATHKVAWRQTAEQPQIRDFSHRVFVECGRPAVPAQHASLEPRRHAWFGRQVHFWGENPPRFRFSSTIPLAVAADTIRSEYERGELFRSVGGVDLMEFHLRANYFDRLYFGLVPEGGVEPPRYQPTKRKYAAF